MDISNYNIEQCDAVSVLNAIIDMHDHPQKIDQIAAAISPIAAAAAAYSEGKPQLAQAITAKGVTTAADASLATMARNVGAIVQSTTILQGGEMYAKQLFGALEAPCFWNLYDVLVNIMSYNTNSFSGSPYSALQGHQFGGIMLFEFPKGDATTSLSDFPLTGGGYIMSDGAAYYNEAPTHTWNDDLDGKGNRWIALLMATEGENFTIASAAVCPSSIYIGGKVGTITYGGTSAGKISEIVVPDGNELGGFNSGSYAQNFGKILVLRNTNTINSSINPSSATKYIYLNIKQVIGAQSTPIFQQSNNITCITIKCDKINGILFPYGFNKYDSLSSLYIIAASNDRSVMRFQADAQVPAASNLKELHIMAENFEVYNYPDRVSYLNMKVYLWYITNNPSYGVTLSRNTNSSTNTWTSTKDIELQDGWIKPLNIDQCVSLTKSNVQDHIFDRLGVNTSGTTVTIHLATAVYDLFTAEEIAAVTTRTSITIARG